MWCVWFSGDMFLMTGYSALNTITMVEGTKAGMAQGELQGALSSLQTVCQVGAPIFWSSVHQYGIARGIPGMFYLGISVVQVVRLALSFGVMKDKDKDKDGK